MAENDTTTYTYTCGDQTGFEYYILGDDIRKEFDFLKSTNASESSISGNLRQMLECVKRASDNTSAFYVSDGAGNTENRLEDLESEINGYVRQLESSLDILHSAIMTDIDNVNAELDLNFGYWKGRKLARHESEKK